MFLDGSVTSSRRVVPLVNFVASPAMVNLRFSNFSLEKRILSGSVGQYVTDSTNSNVQTWKIGVPVRVNAGNGEAGNSFRGFSFKSTNCSFTDRNIVEDVFTQSYDWKMNENTTNLGSVLKLNELVT